jgi:formamidopyrimidine-DNA glycosylase
LKPMPEIPDIEAYIEALRSRVLGRRLFGVRLLNPFLLRTVDPPLEALTGERVEGIERLGKRIVFEVGASADHVDDADGESGPPPGREPLFLVLHLMIAGRLHWKPPSAAVPRGSGLAALDFPDGTLVVTEAGKKRKASIHIVRGREALAALNPGGIEVLGSSPEAFGEALRRENHTLKRALTDPRILSGIGNAYSDEILHRARLSPFKQTRALDQDETSRLHGAAVWVLTEWTERLRAEARVTFPEKVTAFRRDMAAHGRFGAPCPVCGTAIRRIVYAENECDYCPVCQTEGKILADRSLSRLLRDDWPRRVDETVCTPVADDSDDPV